MYNGVIKVVVYLSIKGVIAPDKYFSYLSMIRYVAGTHLKCLRDALLKSTHNICFCR